MASKRPTLSAGDRAKHSLPEFECVPKQFHYLLGILNDDLKGLTHLEKIHTFYKWFEKVAHEVYPGIGSIAHAVPPVFIGTQEKCDAKKSDHKPSLTEAGSVLQGSDQRGDRAHRIVGRCLRILNGQMEMQGQRTMFIMSEIHVDNVLSWLRSDKGARPHENYARCFNQIFVEPVPFVDEEELQNACKARGEADLLVLHQDKGVVLIQVKSVSREAVACAPVATSTQKAPIGPDASIIKKLKAAEKQLKRDQGILEIVMKESPQWSRELSGKVRKVIAVPNLSREDVARFIAEVGTDIIFLCKEDTLEEGPDSIAKAESETDIKHFERWWTHSLPSLPSLPELFDLQCMKQIIGIYIGPLSTVSEPLSANIKERVRSFKNAIKYTGLLFARSLLTNRQTQILETDPQEQRRVYISGPPGSGKTILLALKGSLFLEESAENHVIVVNMYRGAPGRAIGQQTFTMLHKNATHKGRVHHLEVDVEKKEFVDKANRMMIQVGIKTQGSSGVKEAGANQTGTSGSTHTKRQGKVSTGSAQKGKKCKQEVAAPIQCKGGLNKVLFLVDEIYVQSFWQEILDAFSGELAESGVWCAGLFSKNPTGFKERKLNFVLRCPPAVQNLLYHVDWDEERKKKYRRDTELIEVSTNGPIPLCIRHKEHTQEEDHSPVINCVSCAVDLARILNKFKSINTEPRSAPPGASKGVSSKADFSPAGAEMKVVILVNLPRGSYSKAGEYIQTTDAEYNEYMAAVRDSPFIKRLKRKGIEVELKVELACKKLADCPEPPFDAVATWLYNFQGLEGDVVIFLPGDASPKDKKPGHAREIPTPGLRTTSVNSEQEAANACGGPPASQSHGAVAKDAATWGTGIPSTRAGERPPFLNISSMQLHEVEKDRHGQRRPKPAGANDEDMDSTPCSLTPLQWNTADVARYSDWDKTNILIAGSRCLSQLILLVP